MSDTATRSTNTGSVEATGLDRATPEARRAFLCATGAALGPNSRLTVDVDRERYPEAEVVGDVCAAGFDILHVVRFADGRLLVFAMRSPRGF